MPIRTQSSRSSVKGQRATTGTREVGEIYTNFADLQLGVINASKVATDLVAVRFFITTSDYAIGNFVVQSGVLYRAKATVTAGAFSGAQWDAVSTAADLALKQDLIAAGTTAQYWRGDKSWQTLDKAAVGLSLVDNTADASKPVSTAQATAIGLKVTKAGDTMSGHLGLPAGPSPSQAVRKDYVDAADSGLTVALLGKADINNPTFTGDPKAPTPTAGDSDTSIATTAFVQAAVTTAVSTKANLDSPAFTGIPSAPTPSPGDSDTSLATTAFVQAALVPLAPLASPTFTGDPRAPTPATADNDTSIATTAFVQARAALIIAGSAAYIGDAAPSSPAAGQLWWNSLNGGFFIFYNDGSSSQWIQINSTGAL